MKLLPLLDEVAHLPPDEAQRLGRGTLRAVQGLVSAPGEGASLWTRFTTAGHRALVSPNEYTVLEFAEAVTELEKRMASVLTPEELKLFQDEVKHQVSAVSQRAATAGLPMPHYARFRRISTDAKHSTLLLRTAEYQDAFLQRLANLAAGTHSASEELALSTYRQMLVIVGDQGQSGWGRVFTYCAANRREVAQIAPKLRAARAAFDAAPTAANERLLSLAKRGAFYSVRGELAEIYLNFWPAWRIQRESLIELAGATARRLGRNWVPQPFSGGARINGRKAWDEGVLLLKPPSATDRLPGAILHSAAQVKVEGHVTALTQTIGDRVRERGDRPLLTLLEGNRARSFLLEPLPAGEEVTRYIFYARGASLSGPEIARLKAAGIEVTSQPLPLSVEAFDALAVEIVLAAAP